ncbi:MAG: HlyD family secretion protein [Myxococcales bacterium]|nr:HlyD family secretion protein [Myxococcales bacterium]
MTTTTMDEATEKEAPAVAPARSKNRARIVFPVLLLAATAGIGAHYAKTMGTESTDDAQIEGRLYNVSPRIGGRVAKVLVADNQLVEAGTVLIELEDEVQKAKRALVTADVGAAKASLLSLEAQQALTEKNVAAGLKQAKAGVTQASGAVYSSTATVPQAKSDIVAAESRLKLTETELARVKALYGKGLATQIELDARQAAHDQAVASLDAARARLVGAQASVAGAAGGLEVAGARVEAAETGPEQLAVVKAQVELGKARVQQAEANLALAKLDLSYTKVLAPARGVVSRRSVEVGQMVDPSRPLLAVVPKDDLWVVANFKEDQIAHMKPGQRVDVKVDTYGRTFTGQVDSLAAASGARFSLLPPDNASGNFTKVVQRVPVLVRFTLPTDMELRPGMSTTVVVHLK